MTPFARMILRDYADKNVGIVTPPKETGLDKDHVEKLINGIVNAKCFDCSDVMDLTAQLLDKLCVQIEIDGEKKLGISPTETSFLPCERTWVEFNGSEGQHWGCLLDCPEGIGTAFCTFITKPHQQDCSIIGAVFLHLNNGSDMLPVKGIPVPFYKQKECKDCLESIAMMLYPFLAIINSPAVIGRQEFPAHKGFEKSLRHSNVIPPGAHLRPWTKITLDVTPPSGEHGEHGGARLTGAKALHYCRTHIRIKNGKLERVRGHWRGDAALGVVRADYKVKA